MRSRDVPIISKISTWNNGDTNTTSTTLIWDKITEAVKYGLGIILKVKIVDMVKERFN